MILIPLFFKYVLPFVIPLLFLRSWLNTINNNVIEANKKLLEIEGRMKQLEDAAGQNLSLSLNENDKNTPSS